MRVQDARWNQEASTSTSAILASSLGWICKPPNSIQRCAPLPTWPMRSTSTSNAIETPYSGQASRARKRISTSAMLSISTRPKAKRSTWREAYGSGEPPAALYRAA